MQYKIVDCYDFSCSMSKVCIPMAHVQSVADPCQLLCCCCCLSNLCSSVRSLCMSFVMTVARWQDDQQCSDRALPPGSSNPAPVWSLASSLEVMMTASFSSVTFLSGSLPSLCRTSYKAVQLAVLDHGSGVVCFLQFCSQCDIFVDALPLAVQLNTDYSTIEATVQSSDAVGYWQGRLVQHAMQSSSGMVPAQLEAGPSPGGLP